MKRIPVRTSLEILRENTRSRTASAHQVAIGIVEEDVDDDFERGLAPALIQNTLPGFLSRSWGYHSDGRVYADAVGRGGRLYGPEFRTAT